MRKNLVDRDHPTLSIRRQTGLVSVNRRRLDEKPRPISQEESELRRAIDELHLKYPTFGSRRLQVMLAREHEIRVGRGKVRRTMRKMGLTATYRKPRTSLRAPQHPVYPYLLRGLPIDKANQVWCSDITYIPMPRGFAYLTVIMDWATRAVLAWRVSNTLDSSFCIEALEAAHAATGVWPEIMNTDQGCQYTGLEWTSVLKEAGVAISMDGKGCWRDNVMVERLWRSVKYEDVYLRSYATVPELEAGLGRWFAQYNHVYPHSSLGQRPPMEVWLEHQRSTAA